MASTRNPDAQTPAQRMRASRARRGTTTVELSAETVACLTRLAKPRETRTHAVDRIIREAFAAR